MTMPETISNVDYYRRVRSLEARQELLRVLRGTNRVSSPSLGVIRIEKPPVADPSPMEPFSPGEQPVTIFEETTKEE